MVKENIKKRRWAIVKMGEADKRYNENVRLDYRRQLVPVNQQSLSPSSLAALHLYYLFLPLTLACVIARTSSPL